MESEGKNQRKKKEAEAWVSSASPLKGRELKDIWEGTL
jgi:hypothetical protein